MKICPKCRTQFGDDLYFCLEDGSTLKDYNSFDPENSIAATDMATLQYHGQPTVNQNKQTNHTTFGQPARRSKFLMIMGGVLCLVLLSVATLVGGLLYFRQYGAGRGGNSYPPSSEPNRSFTPVYPQTPEKVNNIKVEILGKVKNNSGDQFLKCRVTNVGETTISPYSMSLMFYQDDVKIKESSAFVELKYLKPQQSSPAWIGLYGTDKYTSVKVKEPISTFSVRKTDEQLFPKLMITESKMQVIYSTSYKVSGIIENQDYEKISPQLYVVFYDENSEIIGVETTRLSDLGKGEKTKFEATISERDLFGKPKNFEIVPVTE